MASSNHRKEVYVEVRNVSPQQAKNWMRSSNPTGNNRDVDPTQVVRLLNDMRADRWILTPDPIAFDSDGMLINGQHRLLAIIYYGKPVKMLVGFNFDRLAMEFTDTPMRRTYADRFAISKEFSDVGNPNLSLAVAARMILGLRHTSRTLSDGQRLNFFIDHKDAIQFAQHCLPGNRGGFKGRGIRIAAVVAVMARAYVYYGDDIKSRLLEFGEILFSGKTEKRKNFAAISLRDYLLRVVSEKKINHTNAEVVYGAVENALDCFIRGVDVKTSSDGVILPVAEEFFPIQYDEDIARIEARNNDTSIIRDIQKKYPSKTMLTRKRDRVAETAKLVEGLKEGSRKKQAKVLQLVA
jgi:hypothetical protein